MPATRRTAHAAALVLLPALTLLAGCANRLVWRPDLGGAMNLAAREDRFVVVAYWSDFNDDCALMDRTVFSSPEVRETMRGTVPVKLTAGFHDEWARRLGITRVPSFVVYAPDGRILRRQDGYMDADSFRGFIVAAKLSI